MKNSVQAIGLALMLLVLSVTSWYFARSTPAPRLDPSVLSRLPDTIITNLRVTQYNADGRISNRLQTPFIQHTPANDTHWLKQPLIFVTQADQPTLEIRSDEATAYRGGDELLFKNHVVIHQQPDKNTPESTLTTEELTYFPKSNMATTNAKITYERPGSTVHSIGMRAYLNEKRVQLLQHAEATYDPKHG